MRGRIRILIIGTVKPPRSSLVIPIVLFSALLVLLAAAGWQYYRQGSRHIKGAAAEELEAICDLKRREILSWHRERLVDAAVIAANPFNALQVVPILDGLPGSEAHEGEVKTWLETIVAGYGYMDALLLDIEGRVRIASGSSPAGIGDHARRSVEEACASREARMSDFHRIAETGDIHLGFCAPILRTGPGAREDPCAGVILLRFDPRKFLYPLIQDWPVPSSTGETLLVRREGKEVLYLNDLRHRPGTAMALRAPADAAMLPAAMALREKEGVFEGIDYRGVKVLSVIHPLPGTPWFMVAKEDLSEILAPLRIRTAAFAGVLVVLSFGIGAMLLFWIKRRESHYYRKQYEIEHDRLAVVRHFEYLHKYANDIIFLADRDHRIVEANERARTAYGYSLEELNSLRVPDLRPPQARPAFAPTMREAEKSGGLVFETVHQRKDGTVFPVEVSLRVLNIDGVRYHQAIIRDVSERKKAEERILDALREKDVLLREIHHRVKNNMQIISSLLSLQSQKFRGAEVVDAFRESQDRIRSMALVHEKLYQTRDLSRIDFSDYVKSLTSFLFKAYKTDETRIALKLDLDKVFLDINAAVPCGLILNELVLNALKHAFPDERKGKVTVELRGSEAGTVRLTVRDDGIGFPEGIEIAQADTMGLQIISLLTEQLDGRVEVKRDSGTAFSVSFKVPTYAPRI